MIRIPERLTLKNIHEKVSQHEIMSYIFPEFNKIGKKFKIRAEDDPSASIIKGSSGDYIIRDFGSPDQCKGETWWRYIQRTKFENSYSGYMKTLQWANDVFLLSLRNYTSNRNTHKSVKRSYYKNIQNNNYTLKQTKIEVKRRPFTKHDLEYWNLYGITKKKLEEKKIASLKCFWITNFKKGGIRIKYNIPSTSLCFVYPYYRSIEGTFMYKIYQPNNKKSKWISNITKDVIQNIEYIPKCGSLLFIQSSFKDIMCMEMLGDYKAIAPNGEGIWFTEADWYKLKSSWSKIVLFGNNDCHKLSNPGLKFCRRYSLEYNIPFITVPNNNKNITDFSDYYKVYRRDKAIKLLNELLTYVELL